MALSTPALTGMNVDKFLNQHDRHLSYIYQQNTMDNLFNQLLSFVSSNILPIDILLESVNISFDEMKFIIEKILEIFSLHLPHYNLGITSKTMTKLLQKKEETQGYLDLYFKIMEYCHKKKLEIFNYNHLYYLVLQIWMDPPHNIISISFRKKLIKIGLNGILPNDIIQQIKIDINIWLANIGKNQDITDLIDWLCEFDDSCQLLQCKNIYEKNMERLAETTKIFQKMYNMTFDEYMVQQQKAKKNGLCKFIREGKECIYGVKCMFYHGKIEETYGIQPCRHGNNCSHLTSGECKFVHEPTPEQYNNIVSFYSSFCRDSTGYFYIDVSKMKFIDTQCKNNPFVILKKEKYLDNYVFYSIPYCNHIIENEYHVKYECGNPVKFMSKKNGKINFYCSYDHMVSNEGICSYIVKQNILDDILEEIN